VHLNKSNKWDAARDVLLVTKRVEGFSQLHRTPRTYQKRSAQYWEHELKEKRTNQKRRMDDEKQAHINENNDSNNVPDTENMSPTELRQALRKIGIKTCVRNVKQLQEMFQDAVQNAHEAV
jgi:hypothetical protein